MRRLIVNADDLGQSPGINRAIRRAHESGIVTSASLMVLGPFASEAAEWAINQPNLSVGLHVDLGEWSYRQGEWRQTRFVVPPDDAGQVAAELAAQLKTFRRLMGRDPTHLDSHQHVHRDEPARSALLQQADQLNVPVRHFSPRIRYCGDFYGQDRHNHPSPQSITPESLIRILQHLPEGITELACHPGEGDDSPSGYNVERAQELRTLCDPRVRATIQSQQITLINFADIRG
jgi:predicted glycoside hydrolase/deacetylase ChbG (UPF0249 family)